MVENKVIHTKAIMETLLLSQRKSNCSKINVVSITCFVTDEINNKELVK